ncbi:MAG: oligopeptide transporter, OPT family [Elusimicrobia bacterium]|nr:oligopeptide transporter, OPT family [Elusimicrobiota bacterium]
MKTIENRREGLIKDEFRPYIADKHHVAELTWRAISLGVLLGVVFGAANAYLGMKIGMTISASIPAAVISMAILRALLKKGTVLENNMVQTIASSGEALAAGVIFTIPGFLVLRHLLRWDGVAEEHLPHLPSMALTFLMTLTGGLLGALLMIPLRRYLIVKEHGTLPYPEGTACAEILQAGEEGGARAGHVLSGIGIGSTYMALMKGLKLWKDEAMWMLPKFHKGAIGLEPAGALLGVGFIIGPKVAAYMFAGGIVGWLVLMPLFGLIGSFDSNLIIPPATKPLAQLGSWEIASLYIRYIGAGAVALGGIISLIKTLPVIFSSFSHSWRGLKERLGGRGARESRTDQDLSMAFVFGGSFILALLTGFILYIVAAGTGISHAAPLSLIGGFVSIIFSFFFITVAARIVGIVGSSSSPVSGMTITSLLAVCLTLVGSGLVTRETSVGAMAIALAAGAVICIAVCSSGDISQDLKTGYLLGATPYKQQIAEIIGALIPSIAIVATVYLLILRGGGLNTVPLYEGRVDFRNDAIIEERYQGKLGTQSKNLQKIRLDMPSHGNGDIKSIEVLSFDSGSGPMVTALDVLSLKTRQVMEPPKRTSRKKRTASPGVQLIEGKLLSKSSGKLKFLSLDGRVIEAEPQEVASLARGARIATVPDDRHGSIDPDNHHLLFRTAQYGVVPTGLNLVVLPDQTALEGKIFLKGLDAGGEWFLWRDVDGRLRRWLPGEYAAVIAYDDPMGDLRAPQANIMAILVKGIMDGKLPWALVFIGAMLSAVVELLGISSLAFAIGLYLGIATNAAIMAGGLVWLVSKKISGARHWGETEQRGILLTSGIIAGDALMGIALAFLTMTGWGAALELRAFTEAHWEDYLTLGIFLALAAFLTKLIVTAESNREGS